MMPIFCIIQPVWTVQRKALFQGYVVRGCYVYGAQMGQWWYHQIVPLVLLVGETGAHFVDFDFGTEDQRVQRRSLRDLLEECVDVVGA